MLLKVRKSTKCDIYKDVLVCKREKVYSIIFARDQLWPPSNAFKDFQISCKHLKSIT